MANKPKTVAIEVDEVRARLREAVLDECKRDLATDHQRSVGEILTFWGSKIGLEAEEMCNAILNTKN